MEKKPYQLHVRVLVTKLRGPRDHPVSFYTRRRGIKQCYYETAELCLSLNHGESIAMLRSSYMLTVGCNQLESNNAIICGGIFTHIFPIVWLAINNVSLKHTNWKGMKNHAGKWCQKLCIFLFEVIFASRKMYLASGSC